MKVRGNQYPRAQVVEDTMREGMQIESAEIPVREKIRLLDAISETGVKTILVASFVIPKRVPQTTCIEDVDSLL